MPGVQVVLQGNPRQGAMSEEETEQSIHDIVSWFQRKANLKSVNENPRDLECLEKSLSMAIPKALRTLLKKQSGGIWFDEYKSLTAEEIAHKVDSFSSLKGWKSTFVPFAVEVDGGVLVIDVAQTDAVYEFDATGALGKQRATSFVAFLESFRNRLLSGQSDFVEGVGLVQRSRK